MRIWNMEHPKWNEEFKLRIVFYMKYSRLF